MMRTLGMVVALGLTFAACGGDDGDKGTNESPNKGEDNKNDGKTRSCGADTCKLPEELEGEELCCIDEFTGGCGVKAGSSCREYPDVDKRCPAPDIMVNFPGANDMKVFGCCTGSNQCGVDFGMGCQPRTLICNVVGVDQIDQIEHQTCDGEPLDLPANCGMTGFRPPIPGAAGSGS